MTPAARAGAPFLVLGFAFVAIGASGQRAFVVIGGWPVACQLIRADGHITMATMTRWPR